VSPPLPAYRPLKIRYKLTRNHSGRHPRHGTRVTTLAEKPFNDPKAPTRREALGLLFDDEIDGPAGVTAGVANVKI